MPSCHIIGLLNRSIWQIDCSPRSGSPHAEPQAAAQTKKCAGVRAHARARERVRVVRARALKACSCCVSGKTVVCCECRRVWENGGIYVCECVREGGVCASDCFDSARANIFEKEREKIHDCAYVGVGVYWQDRKSAVLLESIFSDPSPLNKRTSVTSRQFYNLRYDR